MTTKDREQVLGLPPPIRAAFRPGGCQITPALTLSLRLHHTDILRAMQIGAERDPDGC